MSLINGGPAPVIADARPRKQRRVVAKKLTGNDSSKPKGYAETVNIISRRKVNTPSPKAKQAGNISAPLKLVPKKPAKAAVPDDRGILTKQCKEHNINPKHIDTLGLRRVAAHDIAGATKFGVGPGTETTYFDLDGKKREDVTRFRIDDEVLEKNPDCPKYLQKGKGAHLYLCPLIKNWRQIAEDTKIPLYITEGEFKAMAACQRGFRVMALGGVTMGQSKWSEDDLIEEFELFKMEDRWMHILFDSEAKENVVVKFFESEQMRTLVKKGARVKIVRLPIREYVDKVGLDDYFTDHSNGDLFALCEQTREHKYSKRFHELRATYCDFEDILRLSRYPLPSEPVVIDFKHIEPAPALPLYSYKEWLTGQSNNTAKLVRLVRVKNKNTKNEEEAEEESKPQFEALPEVVNVAEEWFASPMRKRFAGPWFAPGKDLYLEREGRTYLNFWKPTGIEPKKGDTSWFDELSCPLFPDQDQRQLMLCWAAYPLQNIGARNNWAPMVWHRQQGIGKTTWGLFVAALHGPGNWNFVTHQELQLPYNDWHDRKTMIVGDDLCGPTPKDYREFGSKVDAWITGPTITINNKYGRKYPIANHGNYYFSTNHGDALPMTEYTRRFFLPDVGHGAKGKIAWGPLYKKAGSIEGQKELLWHLLHINLDLLKYDPNAAPPRTKTREAAEEQNRTHWQEFMRELAQRWEEVWPNVPTSGIEGEFSIYVTSDIIYQAIRNKWRSPKDQPSPTAVSKYMEDAGFTSLGQIDSRKHKKRRSLWTRNVVEHKKIDQARGTFGVMDVFLKNFPKG